MSDMARLPRADVEKLVAELAWLREDQKRLRARVDEMKHERDLARREANRWRRAAQGEQEAA